MHKLTSLSKTLAGRVICLSLLFSCFFLTSAKTYGQDSKSQDDILIVAEVMPAFPGGPKALIETIQKYIIFPEDEYRPGLQGKVVLKFAVDKTGKAILPTIVKGMSPGIDKAVLDVVKRLPKFEPGKQNGEPVSVWFAIPVAFTLK